MLLHRFTSTKTTSHPSKQAGPTTASTTCRTTGLATTTTNVTTSTSTSTSCWTTTFNSLFGFELKSLASCPGLVALLCRPADPACLGVSRILFGFLMVLDVFTERGMNVLDIEWDESTFCRFPLFPFLRPLPVRWMCVVYIIMFSGACGIMLGYKYRYSCIMYLLTYWYIFILDKTRWNNHSYLFGTLAFLFTVSDAHRFCSIDGYRHERMNNTHVPLWNYTLLRTQIILVYFIAGLKKLNLDWIYGYSLKGYFTELPTVLSYVSYFLSGPQIALGIHICGLIIDLFVGFVLFFDGTRKLGLLISMTFHILNSIMFNIGMFPYVMMTSGIFFCSNDWPRRLYAYVTSALRIRRCSETASIKTSDHCIYSKDQVKSENGQAYSFRVPLKHTPKVTPTFLHKLATSFTLGFMTLQCFLPYSHFVTKGLNSWTNGLYGYSWNMMVDSWVLQHARITYREKDTGHSGYIDPYISHEDGRKRWPTQACMIKQYAACVAESLRQSNITNVEIYFDIWYSHNHRFQQRIVNPHVDILTADWNLFEKPSWMLPLLTDLSDWREKFDVIKKSFDDMYELVYVADFPGFSLENYVEPDFENTSLTVLEGRVVVEFPEENRNITLGINQTIQIPEDSFHLVHVATETVSCYMYSFTNQTKSKLWRKYKHALAQGGNSTLDAVLKSLENDTDLNNIQSLLGIEGPKVQPITLHKLKAFFQEFYADITRSWLLAASAVFSIATNTDFDAVLNISLAVPETE
ncbi:vitamin K-dependent gamma-carboxylase-like [Physella acuta]|uniref:vitamin K-dependent gamma-carboxylase-like n=1 Tax=Physella acuta TaxID=109671 RepID=UPI0027DE53A8|nr:vitamin K-dependent gamma-carboxylase-like [Physella acuta]